MKFIKILKATKYFFEKSYRDYNNPEVAYCAVLKVSRKRFKELIEPNDVIYEGNLNGEKVQILSAGILADNKPKLALYNDQSLTDIGYLWDVNTTTEFDPTASKYFVFK